VAKPYKFNNKLPRPSFIQGISKMADFGSLRERYAELLENENADYHALLSDWIAVGEDFQKAYTAATKELTESV